LGTAGWKEGGAFLHERLVAVGSRGVRVRRLGGNRAGEIRITRFLRNPAKIDRVAIISTEKFLSEVIRIGDALSRSTVRHFAPSEADEARRWLKSA
jgi:hypothetical protein